MMAKINGINTDKIKKDGYIDLHEPAVGAGGMVLAYAEEVKSVGYNPSRNLYVECWDIDCFCAFMTFTQLSLYDIPAKIVCGDTLSLKERFVLYTPSYYVFKELLKQNKLNAPDCSYCNKIILDDVYTSEFDPTKKLCSECYRVDKMLSIVRDLQNLK